MDYPRPSFWYGRHSRRTLLAGAMAATLLPAPSLAGGAIRTTAPLANPAQLGYAWVGNHGLDFNAYQAEFDSLTGQGFRLRKLSGYSVNGQSYFASIWDDSPGPAWVSSHAIPDTDYQGQYDAWVADGFRPVDISGYEADGRGWYAAIFENDGLGGWAANHGIAGPDYQGIFDQSTAQGLRPVRVSGFTVGGSETFASIWVPDNGTPWAAMHGVTRSGYQTEFENLTAQGFHVSDVSGYEFNGEALYTGIFDQSDEVGAWWIANHDIPEDEYQTAFNENGNAGYTLTRIAGYGVGGGIHYAAMWETNTEPANPAFAALDTLANNAIAAASVPGVSVAIARDGQLVFAKGYGMADAGAGEAMTADHRLRIASIAKPITATAIMLLEEQGVLSRDDFVFGDAGWLGNEYGTEPYNDFMFDIRIDHLLTHTSGGWGDSDFYTYLQPGSSRDEVITLILDSWPPAQAPGTAYGYSNFGYWLLGRIIERATGEDYEQWVQGNVLAACDIIGMQLGGDNLADRAADEVVYDGSNAPFEDLTETPGGDPLDPPVVRRGPYDIPVHRMDAHGGWIGTPTDLLRFLVRMDAFPDPADVLSSATLTTMTTGSSVNAGYGRGWAIHTESGNWFHDGRLAGTESILVRRSDGVSFAVIANGSGINVDELGHAMANSDVDWGAGTPL